MLIYGYRNRESEIGTGNFYCPKCETQRLYKFKKITRYFTLFFIPLFPLGTVSQYIECSVCGRTYKPEVLSLINSTAGEPATDSTFQNLPQPVLPAQGSPKARSNSCLPWALISLGILFLVAGGIMGIGILGAQSEGNVSSSLASLILALVVCPGGLALVGALGIGAGFVLLRNKSGRLSA
jgi:rubredoxin